MRREDASLAFQRLQAVRVQHGYQPGGVKPSGERWSKNLLRTGIVRGAPVEATEGLFPRNEPIYRAIQLRFPNFRWRTELVTWTARRGYDSTPCSQTAVVFENYPTIAGQRVTLADCLLQPLDVFDPPDDNPKQASPKPAATRIRKRRIHEPIGLWL
ncbi:hypothetical protein C4552_03830 [Candidatus Parcubacteria bacterium]|nr:MAG: hypothetical protein C4552_03830 [Candidatus Parcubacteria bacterium]